MRTALLKRAAIFAFLFTITTGLVSFLQTNITIASPDFFYGELSCESNDLSFNQIADFNAQLNSDRGAKFGALWASSVDEYERYVDGAQLNGYSGSYSLTGSCSGIDESVGGANIEFVLYPKESDVRVWEGVGTTSTFGGGIGSTYFAAIRFTFTDSFDSYEIEVLEENDTRLSSNGGGVQTNLNNAYTVAGIDYVVNTSLREGNYTSDGILRSDLIPAIIEDLADTVGSPTLPPPSTRCSPFPLCEAEITAIFEDAAHIIITSVKFNNTAYEDIDTKLIFFDEDLEFADQSGRDDLVYTLRNEVCDEGEYNRIDFDGNDTSLSTLGANPTATLRLGFKGADGVCTTQPQEIPITIVNSPYAYVSESGGNPDHWPRVSEVMYRLVSELEIRRADAEDGDEFKYVKNDGFKMDPTAPEDAFVYTESVSSECREYIQRDATNIRKVTYYWDRGNGNCDPPQSRTSYLLVNADNTPVDPVLPGQDTDTNENTDATCESGIGSFGGLICAGLELIDSFIGWAEDKIENQLTVDLGEENARESLQSAWRVVARLASGILVAIALVMVIATALGSDLVSPYALKKVLPRLVIGAIGIWLSWALVTTYIGITNDLGKGVQKLMLAPFVGTEEFGLAEIAAIANPGGATGGIFIGLATAGLLSAGAYGLLSMGAAALFAFLVAIFVLALRQAVIVFLVVLAPLGFAMWILPNTQKTWKLWSGTLNKLLIMYPMIMGLLAAGKIFAWITAETARADQGLDKFLAFSIALIAYVAPYFFLPALFKAAGGVFSNLTGMVNDKGKGLFDKFKGGIDKRKALSNRELGKAQRENLRKINRQAGYAQGMTGTGFLAGSRRRIRGGRFGLSSQETRDKMQAGAWGIVTKDQEDTMKGYEAMLNNSYKQLAAAGRLPRVRNARTGALEAQSEGGWLEAQVAGSTGEMRVALLGRMAKTRSFEELRRVHGTFRGIANEGARRSAQGDWLKAIGQNSDALREPAPDIAGSTGDALDYRRMPAASSDSAAKWDMSTWQSLAAVNPAGARAAANRVLTDDRAERLLNDGVRSYLRTL